MSHTPDPVLLSYLLHLADTTLILSQRNAEWCGHGPVLEQDIAITNISLDLLGQARNFYQYAAQVSGNEATEDTLAYLRKEREFRNHLITELPNGDWAQTVLRQFFFSNYQFLFYTRLAQSSDAQLAAIAAKALKEVTYHLRWSSEWVIRLGDGTPESHARMQKAVSFLWPYTGEFFNAADFEQQAAENGIGVNVVLLEDEWDQKTSAIFDEATLPVPAGVFMQTGGKYGKHTEHLGYILTDLQYLQRTYPGAEW